MKVPEEIDYRTVSNHSSKRCTLCESYNKRECKTLKGTKVRLAGITLVRMGRVQENGLCNLFKKL